MRCPACGARNTEGADWCTQCYASLGLATSPPVVETAVGPDPEEPHANRDGAPTGGPRSPSRDVRTVDDEVEWRCARCRTWSPLLAAVCATCGAPRTGFGQPVAPPAVRPGDRGRLIAASVVVPGLGHLLAGRVGTGLARLLLGCSWAAGGLAIARGAGAAGRLLPAIPLLLGAAIVWAASIRDVAVLGEGPELLRPKVLGGLTIAVVGTLLLAAVASASGGVTPG